MDWQPIATAPKDGSFFLAAYDAPLGGFGLAHWWQPPDGREAGWYNDRYSHAEAWAEITHWMPLPPPPEGETP